MTYKAKILLIGNMNNNLFVLQRYLLDLNYEAYLYVLSTDDSIYFPDKDTLDFERYKPYIKFVNWGSDIDYFKKRREIKKDLKEFDAYIGCGLAPLFVNLINKSLDIYIPYGSDLYELPFEGFSHQNIVLRYYFRFILRKQLSQTKVCVAQRNFTALLNPIQKLKIKNIPIGYPYFYDKNTLPYTINKVKKISKVYKEFKKLRIENDIIILNHSRQIWKTFIDPFSFKGNDVLIKAFASFIKKTKKKCILIMFNNGIDVDASKELVSSLGISKNIIWMDPIKRLEIYSLVIKSDLVFDQIITGQGYGGTALDGMVLGTPSIAYFYNHFVKSFPKDNCGKPFPPHININTEKEILETLLDLEKNPEKYKKIGKDTKKWANDYFGFGLAKKYDLLIKAILKKKPLKEDLFMFS